MRDADVKREIGIGWMPDRDLSGAATAFRDFVIEERRATATDSRGKDGR